MSAPDLTETIGELRDLLADLRHEADQVGYGVFPGGDPRTFSPDPDASTEAERKAWADDCARVERGERPITETRCDLSKPIGRMMRSGYGLGTYTMEDPQAKDWAERLERAISQLDTWATEEP